MGVLDRFAAAISPAYFPQERSSWTSFGLDDYMDLLHTFNGNQYVGLRTTFDKRREEPIVGQFESIMGRAYKRNGVVFAAVLARALVFSEARFKYRQLSDKKLFGDESLFPLERPGVNQTTGELLFRMEQDASLDGNWFGTNRWGGVRRLRPDWVFIVLGSDTTPDDPSFAEDAHVVGYVYKPGGMGSNHPAVDFLPDEIAHWSPIPDPAAQFRGMSWIEVVAREVMADNAGTDMRLSFYENGATPNLVLTAPEWVVTQEQFDDFKRKMNESTVGVKNAFKNLFLAAGGSATRVGLGMNELDFKVVQAAGETRIAVASRVPATLLGISEGLAGSSLNQGNYAMARRQFADGFLRPQWRSACACLSKLVQVPAGSELWFDESEVSFLREDAKDAAEIMQVKAGAIRSLIDAGFDPQSAVSAVRANDEQLLTHTGLVSVQLNKPGSETPEQMPSPDSGTEDDDDGE